MAGIGDIFESIGGWFVPIYIIILLISGILLPAILSLSPAQTEFVQFYSAKFWHSFILVGLTILLYIPLKKSFFPIGQHDEERYPLQAAFGYNGAFIIALVMGVVLFIGFYNIVSTTKQVFIPVPQILVPGLQTVSRNTRDFFSGHDVTGNALSNSLLPTFYENPVYMYLPMMITWLVVYYILTTIGFEKFFANIISALLAVIVAGILFALVAHAFSYQDNQPAYQKAMIFVTTCALPTAASGFPIPCDAAHIANNWAATTFSVFKYISVIAPVYFIGFIAFPQNRIWLKNIFTSSGKYLKVLYNQKCKESIMLKQISAIFVITLFITPLLVSANIITDIIDIIKKPFPFSTQGFTTLSVDKIDMLSREPSGILSGQVYALHVTTGGYGNLGQYAYAASTNTFQTVKASDGTRAKYGVKIDVESTKQEARYTINDKVQGDWSIVQYKLLNCGLALTTSAEACLNKITESSYTTIFNQKLSNTVNRYVLYAVPVTTGVYNLPERPKILSEVKVTLQREDGSTVSGIINNYDKPWATISDKAFATFVGGIKLYDEPPQAVQSNVKATSSAGNRNWYLIDGNAYSAWKSRQSVSLTASDWLEQRTELLFTTTKSPAEIQTKADEINRLAATAMKSISWENGYFQSSDYVIDVDNSIYMNDIMLYVKSDWLGIYTPTSSVSITNVVGSDFKVGNEGLVKVTVKNTGDERASVNIGLNCPSFTSSVASKTVTVNPNEEQTVTLRATAEQVQSKKCETCTVTANTLATTAIKTVSLCALPADVVLPPIIDDSNTIPTVGRTCYQLAEDNLPFWMTGTAVKKIFSIPAKFICYLKEKSTNIVIGLILASLMFAITFLWFKIPPQFAAIPAAILFLLTLKWLLVGIIILVLAIAGLVILVMI